MSTKSKKTASKKTTTAKLSPKVVEIYSQVVAKVDCPKCKSKRGHRCIFSTTNKAKGQKKGDKRNKPHRQRIAKLAPSKHESSSKKVTTMKKKSA